LAPFCGHDPTISWRGDLTLPGAVNLHHVQDYFMSLPDAVWDARRPAQELLVHSDAPEGVAAKDGRVDVMTDGKGWVLVHSGQGYGFELDVPQFAGEAAEARWIDPRDGTRGEAFDAGAGKQRFEPPSRGSVRDDWLLEIVAKS
jgi:hypothetical protein